MLSGSAPGGRTDVTMVMLGAHRMELERDPTDSDEPRADNQAGRIRHHGVEEQLLASVAGGDHGSFAELYDLLSPLVFGIARRILHDADMAAEVTQEAFCEIWRSADRFDPTRAPARAWVVTLAHRRAVDRVRSEQASRNREQREGHRYAAGGAIDMEDEVVGHLQLGATRARVRTALNELSAVQRESIELAYFQGLSYPQVAQRLDVPLGTIKTRIRDGLLRLRQTLGTSE
jgi:RNA polymerase sigma-70 factor (ECF subfamily)